MSRFVAIPGALATIAFAAFVACADTSDGPNVSPEDGGGTVPPESDAGAPDATADANDGAALPDAALPECSAGGYCHTILPKQQTLRGVWSDDAGTTWAVSEEGAVLRYDATSGGRTWSLHTKLTGPLWSIWGSGPTNLWIGGPTGLFHGTGASAKSLVFVPVATPGPSSPITSIWGTGDDDVWATGSVDSSPEESRLLHHTGALVDGAPVWTLDSFTGESAVLKRVFGGSAGGVWIAGQWENPEMFDRREIFLARRKPGASRWIHEVLPSDPAMPDSEGDFDRFYDAAVSTDGASIWILGRTHGRIPAFAVATSNDGGGTFAFTFGVTGNTSLDPKFNAIGGTAANQAFVIGDYGGLYYREGLEWKQAVITVTKFPLTAPFYAMGGRESEFWFVGKDIALRRDPSKIKP